MPQTRQGMLTGYDFNRIELSLPNASLIFRSAEGKRRNFLNASPQEGMECRVGHPGERPYHGGDK